MYMIFIFSNYRCTISTKQVDSTYMLMQVNVPSVIYTLKIKQLNNLVLYAVDYEQHF